MKKIIAICLLLALSLPLFAGCADLRPAREPAVTTMPWEDPTLSEEDRKIREITDPEIIKLYGTTDFSNFTIDIYDNVKDHNSTSEPRYSVYYRFELCGIRTEEQTRVELNSDFTVADVKPYDNRVYSSLQNKKTIDAIQTAKAKIEEKVKDYDESRHYYYAIDDEGYLCLKMEMIVYRAPDDPDTSGCGDHDHKMYSERVCKIN